MALDSTARNRLQKMVAACRDRLTGEFDDQLKERYGIYADEGRVMPIEKLEHLDDAERRTAELLRERIVHLAGGDAGGKTALTEPIRRVLREEAFTILNRFAAVRMAEERGIVPESVGGGFRSKGFQVFETIAGSGLGGVYDRYRVYLGCLYDELATDLRVLFERFNPQALLFPGENALRDLFDQLNAADIKSLWGEDETIGWIYQYFNDSAERKKMRKESAAPRNSRELAVRNQFFTPRYVVAFLVDNTLGRIWYEMCRGETGLRDLEYLVCRSNEKFLLPGEKHPEPQPETRAPGDAPEPSQEELLKQTVVIPHRPLKDPREIRLLDPACGSMHFGLYAFDLYERIYEEAYDLAVSGAVPEGADPSFASFVDFASTFPSKTAFQEAVPAMIVENNIHGMEIDPRCVQIAALALWLRAQKSWERQQLKPADRPVIKKSNIVCAEPMPGDKKLLEEFTSDLHPPFLGQIVEKVWDAMRLAGEAGSLLKIESQISGWMAEAKRQWKALPKSEQLTMFDQAASVKQKTLDLDLSGITDETFWEQAEERIYEALRSYSRQAENDNGWQRHMFAEDAEHGFAFIDLCNRRYDAVVMNPPFGDWSARFKTRSKKDYPNSYNDILAAFVERGGDLMVPGGRLGAITSRTCFFLSSFTKWREHVVLSAMQPELLVDLGYGVMDAAMVEAAAYVLAKPGRKTHASNNLTKRL